MQLLNILVVEDEALIAWNLKNQLTKDGYHVVGTCNNGKEALEIFGTYPVDLVLLDIHIIGEMDGIDVANAIRQKSDIPLIFLTAMSGKSFVDRAKLVQPSAYLLKPYQAAALHIAIEMAMSNFEAQAVGDAVQVRHPLVAQEHNSLLKAAKEDKDVFLVQQNFAIIKPQKIFVKIKIDDILYIESDHVYIKIHTVQQTYLLRTPLQKVADKLNGFAFTRIHRSFIVNMDLVERFDEENVYINRKELPISRAHKEKFLQYFR